MKKLVVVMAMALVSTQSFASSCTGSALELTQASLDQKARAYGQEGSDVEYASLKLVGKDVKTGNSTFKVDGYIYKASYTVTVTVDSLCGLESLNIKENL